MTSSMSVPSRRPFPKNHPLEGDEARLDHIAHLMWATIQKVLFPQRHAPPYPPDGPERALAGGTSAEHVLQDALTALLYYDEAKVQSTWEAVGVSIARNKAVEALRKATKGRRRSAGPELQLVSLDANREAGEELRDDVFDAEAEYIAINQQLALRRLAQQVLSGRDRDIYYARDEDRCRILNGNGDADRGPAGLGLTAAQKRPTVQQGVHANGSETMIADTGCERAEEVLRSLRDRRLRNDRLCARCRVPAVPYPSPPNPGHAL